MPGRVCGCGMGRVMALGNDGRDMLPLPMDGR
jgi:hypothetical protein